MNLKHKLSENGNTQVNLLPPLIISVCDTTRPLRSVSVQQTQLLLFHLYCVSVTTDEEVNSKHVMTDVVCASVVFPQWVCSIYVTTDCITWAEGCETYRRDSWMKCFWIFPLPFSSSLICNLLLLLIVQRCVYDNLSGIFCLSSSGLSWTAGRLRTKWTKGTNVHETRFYLRTGVYF